MSIITRFEKQHFPTLRVEIDEALKIIGTKHGLVFHAGNVKFDAHVAEFKLHVATLAETGEAFTKEAEDFKRYARSFGFAPEDLGRRYVKNGLTYTLVGIKPACRTYPMLVACSDGKRYKIATDSLAFNLKLHEVK